MPDPMYQAWPEPSHHRKVVRAQAQMEVGGQNTFVLVFEDSAGKQLKVQIPETALRIVVETGAKLLAATSDVGTHNRNGKIER